MFDAGALDVEALAEAAPGAELAATLAGIDPRLRNGCARVVVLQAWQRQVSWSSGQLYDVMALVAKSPASVPESAPEVSDTFGEFASAEVGAALTLSPGAADRELSFAYELTERLPRTRAALPAGLVDLGKAREIAAETCCLPSALAAQAETFILDRAPALTRQQLARRLRAKVLALDPAAAEERRQDARRGRRVRFDAGVDGTAHLYDLPLVDAAAAQSFVKLLARKLHTDRGRDDARTPAQIEADVFVDLLRGRHLDAEGLLATVELVAPVETWLRATAAGADDADAQDANARRDALGVNARGDARRASGRGDALGAGSRGAALQGATRAGAITDLADLADAEGAEPGVLAGYGPVSAEVIAEISRAATGVTYTCTATRGETVVYHGSGGYRPTRADRDFTRARDRTCRHPGCSRPAPRCDIDHTMEHRLGGPTCPCNLVSLCRRHHRARHAGGWWWSHQESGTLTARVLSAARTSPGRNLHPARDPRQAALLLCHARPSPSLSAMADPSPCPVADPCPVPDRRQERPR